MLGRAEAIYAEHEGEFIKLDSIVAMDPKTNILILQMQKPENDKEFKSIPDIRIGNSCSIPARGVPAKPKLRNKKKR